MFESRKDFKGAVIGMIMGDGCIPVLQGRSKTHRVEIGHSIKQKDYLEHKAELLRWLTGVRVYEYEQIDSRKTYKEQKIRAITRQHPFYTKLYKHFYHNGRKTIDEHLMKCLTPHGLALLYQDDGCLVWHENAYAVQMYPYMQNKVEMECIARWLAKRFGFEFRVNSFKRKTPFGQPYWKLRLRMKDRDKFFDLIRPFVVPSMEYKIAPKDDWVQKKFHDCSDHSCENCGENFVKEWKWRDHPNRFCSMKCYSAFRHNGEEQGIAAQEIVCSLQ